MYDGESEKSTPSGAFGLVRSVHAPPVTGRLSASPWTAANAFEFTESLGAVRWSSNQAWAAARLSLSSPASLFVAFDAADPCPKPVDNVRAATAAKTKSRRIPLPPEEIQRHA